MCENLSISTLTCILIIIISSFCVDASIGITWGRQSVTTLVPSMVVDILLQNKIKHVKLFNSDPHVLKAFSGTDIYVDLTIASERAVVDENAVRSWINRTITTFPKVNFRYVSVGNNAFTLARYANRTYASVVEKIKRVQGVLDELGYGKKIKVVITHTQSGVLTQNNTFPSKAEFTPEIREAMLDTIRLMERSGAPFIYECFPISQIVALQIDPSYAFSDDNSKLVITDLNGLHYNNLFDNIHDSFIWALRKIGYENIKIIVGSIGFPTDGFPGANVEAAERYWKALLPKVAANRGTPLRPGVPIDVFVHSLTDETNNFPLSAFARHWGIYLANGKPKYKIDLTGQGRDVFPNTVPGKSLMPARWCVFNENMKDADKVKEQFDYACSKADCTAISPGGSCGALTYIQNVSYSFNAYFQSKFQDERACDFEALGKLVLDNPSRDGCLFSIEVVKGTQPSVFLNRERA